MLAPLDHAKLTVLPGKNVSLTAPDLLTAMRLPRDVAPAHRGCGATVRGVNILLTLRTSTCQTPVDGFGTAN
jgi:hypothetical protein